MIYGLKNARRYKQNFVIKAVALKYQMEKDNAPKVTAKGKGVTASNIIKIAKENKIPIQKDEDLIELFISN